jgi:hypothetical protein
MNNNDPGIFVWVILLAIIVVAIAGVWKVFEKAGKPGWACLIPIYNGIVILQIVERPVWWILLYLIPIVNLIVCILVMVELAKSFSKGAGFGVGLAFLGFIFFPVLGFGEAQFVGPA